MSQHILDICVFNVHVQRTVSLFFPLCSLFTARGLTPPTPPALLETRNERLTNLPKLRRPTDIPAWRLARRTAGPSEVHVVTDISRETIVRIKNRKV
jgi:hypothetical protein